VKSKKRKEKQKVAKKRTKRQKREQLVQHIPRKEWKGAYSYDALAQTDGQTESRITRYEQEKKPKTERNRKSGEGNVSGGERNRADHIYITGLTQHHGAACSMVLREPAFSDTWHSCATCRQFQTYLTFLTPVLPI
jgi:uncharacterized protein (DUF305 family)